MKVSQYYEKEISNRPYKYQTKQNIVRCLKKLDLWDIPLALAYNNKFRQKDLQMDIIAELRAEVKELRDRVDHLQGELDSCKTDFYELMEKHLGIIKD